MNNMTKLTTINEFKNALIMLINDNIKMQTIIFAHLICIYKMENEKVWVISKTFIKILKYKIDIHYNLISFLKIYINHRLGVVWL